MADFIKDWIMTLSGIIIFGVVCERIIPKGIYKKYIHLCIGLMLILSLLSPLGGDVPKLEAELPVTETAEEMTRDMSEREKADVLRLYKAKLCERIKDDIRGTAGVDFDIKCEVCGSGDDFGQVERLWITVDAADGVEINEGAINIIKSKYGINKEVISVKYIS